jgi:hypothetical protein
MVNHHSINCEKNNKIEVGKYKSIHVTLVCGLSFKKYIIKIFCLYLIVFYFYNCRCCHHFIFFYSTFEFITSFIISNEEVLTTIVN